jgi:opacity protein-like surface antigen
LAGFRSALLLAVLTLLSAGSRTLHGQEPAVGTPAPDWPPCRHTAREVCDGKNARIHRLAPDESVNVDGRLDDAVWGRAEWISDFVQLRPVEGVLPTERTEVAFANDRTTLYIAGRMYSEDPSQIRAILARRDDSGDSERLIISIDSYLDRRTSYNFAVTAAGGRLDWYSINDEDDFRNRDFSYNPIWTASAVIDSLGWTAEFRIPLSQLRFNAADSLVWGVNLNRYIPHKNEDIFWVAIPLEESGWVSWFGDLEGIRDVRSRRPVEVVPYVSSSAALTSSELVDEDDPFTGESEFDLRAGADVKFGIGPSLTVDATINPDFGQVEADPAVVNLSAFPVFFPERRPFFVERRELLEANGLFYSRRIGAAPSGDVDADYADYPANTTILGAGKLTGRTPGGLSVGTLLAATAEESARTFDSDTGIEDRVRIEPATGWGVLSLEQQFGSAGSTVGVAGTAVRRDLGVDDPLAAEYNRQAYAGSVDTRLRFQGGTYELRGQIAGSYVEGTTERITDLQQFSSHFFQRPDATHVELDTTRTSLWGYAVELDFERTRAQHWLWSVGMEAVSPGFDINDAGRLRRADRIEAGGRLTYRETSPGLFQNYSVRGELDGNWNFDGNRLRNSLEIGGNVTLRSFWRFGLELDLVPRGLSDTQTRGGPLMGTPAQWGMSANVNSDFSRRTGFHLFGFFRVDEQDGWFWNLGGGIESKPTGNWQIGLFPRYERSSDARQYVDTIDDGPEATYGERYVFGRIDRSTLSAQLRISYGFTPNLSLEGYAEPFSATGTYSEYGELPEPRSLDLRYYGTDGTTITESEGEAPREITVTDGDDSFTFERGDFHSLSFRTNLVLRWEWRPGSTLFLIWQQNQGDFESVTDPGSAGLSDWGDAITSPGQSFFALKLTYWLPI